MANLFELVNMHVNVENLRQLLQSVASVIAVFLILEMSLELFCVI